MADDYDETPSFRLRWDVFISFRGEDTRENFTDSLYNALVLNGVRTFRDNEGLKRGDEIGSSLFEAIQNSAASIAVISRSYANSKWCLEELAAIVKSGRLLLPVFYQVDPSDVRHQRGPFEDDFRKLEERFDVEDVGRWRKAMDKAGRTAGWDSIKWEQKDLIDKLMKEVLNKLSNTPMGVAKHPVGLKSRIEEVIGILDVKANGVRVLGLHGMGGVGKTTLAKAVYNKLVGHFGRRSFISNVRETWKNENGPASLQSKLIGDLSKSPIGLVSDVSEGIISIKKLVDLKEPVLVVLDDVDDAEQLNALADRRDWFYEGSRLIITARDKEVLHESIVNNLYEVKELNSSESLQLFSYHAFGGDKPAKDFKDLSDQVILFAGGLPLALEVFGSFLFDKRRRKEWEDVLQKLKRIRPGNLQDVLEMSFNGLDDEEKCIFLDIACFFVQMKMKREDAVDIFRGCGFSGEIAITVLTSRSLIRIIENNTLWMHDQLRDMGRQIVQRENNEDPGRVRSRLWDRAEIMNALKNSKGTERVQGLVHDFEKKRDLSSEEICWSNFTTNPGFTSAVIYLKEIYKSQFNPGTKKDEDVMLHTKAFEPMVNLRLLQINHAKLGGSLRFIAANLKWLEWKGCSLKSLPYDFSLQDIGVLDLSDSKITQLWGWLFWSKNKRAEKLLVLNLHNCYNLTTVPDLSGQRVLEKLVLENCKSLVKIHKSVGDLRTLLHLNLKGCSNLVEFPTDVSGLKKLEKLILSGCSKLKNLPEDMASIKSLKELLVDETAILEVPNTIFYLQKLEKFSLSNCRSLKQLPSCIGKLTSLRELKLDGSAIQELPDSVGSLVNLEKLSLSRCRSLTAIPDSVGNLQSLVEFFLDGSSIEEIPDSIGSLIHLKIMSVAHCRLLSKLPDSIEGLASLTRFWLEWSLLKEVPEQLSALTMLVQLDMGNCKLLQSIPESIGKMLNLTTLSLNDTAITKLPESIGNLESLCTLTLYNCKQLRKLPNSIGKLKSLQYFYMAETAVTELPEDFGMLSSLKILKMAKSPVSEEQLSNRDQTGMINPTAQENPNLDVLPMSFANLSSLQELDARGWRISSEIRDGFEKLSSLEILNVGKNNICSLPTSLRGFSSLKSLLLPNNKELKYLPPLPSSLVILNVANCTALETISDLSGLESLHELNLTNCKLINEIPGLERLRSLRGLYLSGCQACFPAVKRGLTKVALKHLRNLSVPGSEIPDWFVQEIPRFTTLKNRDLEGVLIGIVASLDHREHDSFRDKLPGIVDVKAKIVRLNDSPYTTTLNLTGVPDANEDQLYLCRFKEFSKLVVMMKDGDKLQIVLRENPYFNGLALKKYGFHLIFENEDDIDDEDEGWLDESKQSVSFKLAKFFRSL